MKAYRILFVTRTLQSVPGGMQTQARNMIDALRRAGDPISVVGYRGTTVGLPLFLLRALWQALVTSADVVHVNDALLSPIHLLLSVFRPRIRRTVTVHGLDLTWRFPLYRMLIASSLRRAHRIVAVSRATAEVVVQLGVPEDRIDVLPCGISVQASTRNVSSTPFLLSIGRLIPRKGFTWFIQSVLPLLLKRHPDLRYVIVGDGSEMPRLRSLVRRLHLERHVVLAGRMTEEKKNALLDSCSMLVVPNMKIPGDMEGFGIVCIEAASRGVPTVAADLEGLRDAVLPSITGELFPAQDAKSACEVVEHMLVSPPKPGDIKAACQEHFSLENIVSRFVSSVLP